MNDSKNGEIEQPIPLDSVNENQEKVQNEPQKDIKKEEEANINNNDEINNNIETDNNENNNSKKEENYDFNKNNEFPNNEKIDNFDEYINQKNKNENENKNNNNENYDIGNNDVENKEGKINDENNNENNIEVRNINEDEKIDDSYKEEKNNIRFSSLKNEDIKRNSDINNKSNEPSGFIYDDEDDNQNKEQGKDINNNLNENGDIKNNEFRYNDGNHSENHDYENDFDFGNNDNNFNNNIYSLNNNQNKNQEIKNKLLNNPNNGSNFNFNNNQYTSNNTPSAPIANTQNSQNQTNMNFIVQESPIINSLNNNNMYQKPQEPQKNHSDYDPQFEQYEEFPEDGDGQNVNPNKKGKDSTKTAGAQIANTIMGAGILSIPIIMRYLGFLIGIILIVFLALSTVYSVYVLIRCHEITGKNGYSMFGKITMGTFGSILVKIIIIISNLGLCIAYFRIFGEVVQTIIQAWVSPNSFWATNWHNYLYILFCGLIMIFFIFIKNISSLKKVAYLGIFAVLVFSISLIILLGYKSGSNYLDSNANWEFFFPNCSFSEAFKAIPTVFLAFLFQFNVFPIYLSLRNRNMKSMMKATKYGVGFTLIIFLIIGIIGFLLYGLSMEETILNSFSDDMIKFKDISRFIKILIIIICVSFVTTCLTSFPILFLSLRENYINSLLFCFKNCCKKKNDDEVKINQGKYEKNNNYKYISKKGMIVITFILYFLVLILAIVMPKLKIIFSIVGATAGTFIAFILPNLFYIRICRMSGKNYNIVLPLLFLVFGIFFLIISIIVNFI